MSISHACLFLVEVRRRHWILWKWIFWQLSATVRWLEIKPVPSERAANTFNHWSISPASRFSYFYFLLKSERNLGLLKSCKSNSRFLYDHQAVFSYVINRNHLSYLEMIFSTILFTKRTDITQISPVVPWYPCLDWTGLQHHQQLHSLSISFLLGP